MIKFENTEVIGWEAAIRGIHNQMNSLRKSDSILRLHDEDCSDECYLYSEYGGDGRAECYMTSDAKMILGKNDHLLMMNLRNTGTDRHTFMQMITVYVDITAPLYWWEEFDTCKGSPMDKIYEKEFTLEDFSCEHLISDWIGYNNEAMYYYDIEVDGTHMFASPKDGLNLIIRLLNSNRQAYLKTKDKKYWWQMI